MTTYGYQLYSSRNFPPLDTTLGMLAEAGYTHVEGYGAMFSTAAAAADLRGQLDAAGLTMPTAHMGLDFVESDPHLAVEIAQTLGITTAFAPYLNAPDRPKDAAGWRAFADRLVAAGAPLRAAGLGYGWHNHDFEFAELADGTLPMAALADADLPLELDVAWVIKGGQDPAAWIDRAGDKLVAVHVKDIAPEGQTTEEDGWADVGHGTVDWSGLLTHLRGTPANYFIMEHDNPNDHRRFATRSIAAAQTF
ncbi:MAG: sugar phosphate isomerase/epimerase [Pseudomonadota bacterium]